MCTCAGANPSTHVDAHLLCTPMERKEREKFMLGNELDQITCFGHVNMHLFVPEDWYGESSSSSTTPRTPTAADPALRKAILVQPTCLGQHSLEAPASSARLFEPNPSCLLCVAYFYPFGLSALSFVAVFLLVCLPAQSAFFPTGGDVQRRGPAPYRGGVFSLLATGIFQTKLGQKHGDSYLGAGFDFTCL